jgi:hypothetical protein
MIIYWRGVSVMSGIFLSRRVAQIKGAMILRCFWNFHRVDRRKPKKFYGDLKVVRRVPKGVLELQELNNK